MTRVHGHRPHQPNHDVPDENEPGAPPVEPDEGPVPANIPDDPEHERVIAPGPNQVGRLVAAAGAGFAPSFR